MQVLALRWPGCRAQVPAQLLMQVLALVLALRSRCVREDYRPATKTYGSTREKYNENLMSSTYLVTIHSDLRLLCRLLLWDFGFGLWFRFAELKFGLTTISLS